MTSIENSSKYRFTSAPYHIDRKLYKYYANIDYAIDCIQNRRIHLDDPRSFNDPFDSALGCFHISYIATTESEVNFLKSLLLAMYSLPKSKKTPKHDIIAASIRKLPSGESIGLSSKTIEQPMLNITSRQSREVKLS